MLSGSKPRATRWPCVLRDWQHNSQPPTLLAYRAWLAGGLGAMPLAETEPTARVVTSTASSKTWRDNAKTEGIYKRKKRDRGERGRSV